MIIHAPMFLLQLCLKVKGDYSTKSPWPNSTTAHESINVHIVMLSHLRGELYSQNKVSFLNILRLKHTSIHLCHASPTHYQDLRIDQSFQSYILKTTSSVSTVFGSSPKPSNPGSENFSNYLTLSFRNY